MPFGSFELDPRIVSAVEALGFEEPTPIQTEAIPVLLSGRDVIGGARTGSGKTAAFGLPLLEKVKDGGPVRGLVLCPTRELALQVTEAIRDLAKQLPVKFVTVYGGASYQPQLRALHRGATVVVATPGRLMDLLDRQAMTLDNVEMLVLDEADEMLRMGFIDDVERVMAEVPDSCQVALFSATMPPDMQRVAKAHLDNPVDVRVEGRGPMVGHIEQFGVKVSQRHKLDALIRVLMVRPPGATLVFARTRRGCGEVADALCERGVAAEALHGDLNQAARERVVARLRAGSLSVVIATDVAARGIDVETLNCVINFDLPTDTEGYVHRIGRTGRAGRSGTAISFVTPAERRRVRFLERALNCIIEPMWVPDDAAIARAQQASLAARLDEIADDPDVADARAWIENLTAEGTRTADEVAAQVLTLLARQRGLSLRAAPPERPRYEQDVTREERPQYDNRRPERGPPQRPDRRGSHEDTNEVQLFVGTGTLWGARPGDIVGALANEAGVDGNRIGKIVLLERKTFVGLPKVEAERVLKEFPTLEIRGVNVKLSRSKGAGFTQGGRNKVRRS